LQIIIALAEGLIKSLPNLISKAPQIVGSLVKAIIGAAGQLISASGKLISTLADGIKSGLSSMADAGLNLVKGIWNGISNGLGWIKGKIKGWIGNVTGFIKNVLGIHSPSTVMRDEVGIFLAKGIGVGFEQGMKDVEKSMQRAMPDLTSGYDFNVTGNYNGFCGYGYGDMSAQSGVAIYGDVHISIDGTGQNADQIGQTLYKRLVGLGVAAYAI
jgi:phage-related protein